MSRLNLHQTGPKGPVSVVIIPAKPAASRRADANANAPQGISWIKPAGSECIHPGDAPIVSKDPADNDFVKSLKSSIDEDDDDFNPFTSGHNPKKSQVVSPPDQDNQIAEQIIIGFVSTDASAKPQNRSQPKMPPMKIDWTTFWKGIMDEPRQVIEFATHGGAI